VGCVKEQQRWQKSYKTKKITCKVSIFENEFRGSWLSNFQQPI
jgi:hypothetical protein